jgi:hypothetical protein
MRCPACGGLLRREPASVLCTACARRGEILDATDAERHAQRVLDAALRPCSAECNPEYNVPRPLGWIVGRLRLPGEPGRPSTTPRGG